MMGPKDGDPLEDERQLFLDAMRRLDSAPDQIPKKDPAPRVRSAPRPSGRAETRRRGRRAGRRIDLHGMTRREAVAHLGRLLPELRRTGVRRVVVVTGRGLNSPDGRARLRDAVSAWLRGGGARHVSGFATAPPAEGGEGALVVDLQ